MNLLRFFKREKTKAPAPVAPPPRPFVEKPASERFSKTFLPNATRVMEPTAAEPLGTRLAQPVSLGGGLATGNGSTVDAPARPGERTIALQLVELLAQIPSELLGTGEVDPYQRVVFSASELERGMANGRPAVLLRSIYQQAPTIFTSEVAAEDTREIPLPFHKVLEQFANFQVRDDQESDDAYPQVETPFLQVTLEDGKKFGTPVAAPRSLASSPPPPAAPALAPAIASTTPAPVALPTTETPAPAPRTPIRLSLPPEATGATPPASTPATLPNEPAPPPGALPLTPKIFPNGAGVPITERVPASSGSPVPTPLPSPFAPVKSSSPAPARIPFKVTPPASDLCPPVALPLQAVSAPVAFSEIGPRVRLSLRHVFEAIPPFQLTGPLESVPADAQIELPFSILEPQLSLGRVAISPAQFVAAMPAEYRALYRLDEGGVPVALPLREILENLPTTSLQLRADQEEPEVAQIFETPFSQKAAEDAARLLTPAGPISKTPALATEAPDAPVVAVAEPAPTPAAAPEIPKLAPAAPGPAVGSAAKTIVAELSQLDGVKACAIVFSDGLSLAGNLPEEYEADALCAMAPEILKRINQQMNGANLGTLHHLTLFCEKAPVSFFAHENICLAVLHSTGEISPETRAHLGRATLELARQYATPAAA